MPNCDGRTHRYWDPAINGCQINAGSTAGFLGFRLVVFDLLAVAMLSSALWRPRERDPSSKETLGATAVQALWLGLIYGAFRSYWSPAR